MPNGDCKYNGEKYLNITYNSLIGKTKKDRLSLDEKPVMKSRGAGLSVACNGMHTDCYLLRRPVRHEKAVRSERIFPDLTAQLAQTKSVLIILLAHNDSS